MKIDCLKCVNSACCKLRVEVDRNEYNEFWRLDLDKHFETMTDVFLKENPKYLKRIKELDEMHKDNFAILKRGVDGYCELLDQTTMLCTIYEQRPSVCKNYTSNRCENIRKLCQ